VLKSEQITKYKSLSSNIILTDYLDFVWINKYGPPQRERLCHATDLENRRFRLGEDRVEAVAKLLSGFFSSAPEGIGRAQQLALALATRSRLLRDYLGEELVRQEREHKEGRLYGLFQVFRDQVFHELTLKEFADALAQMLAYGLFLARLNSDSQPITLHNAREYVPGAFRLIQELVDFLNELEKDEYRDVRWVVEEVLSIVNGLNLAAIHEDLSFRQRKAISRKVRAADEEEHRLFERDPFIYFYEDYLRAYDKETSKSRGVYYTPPPIVNFIVRAVDDILKDSFGIPEGLADHRRVTVLDFACGTGTFLLEVFQKIFENIGGPNSGKADLIVREHFLRNIFGFEYLIAPYTIAHLKLSQYLSDQKHPLNEEERLQVFLTNTLEPVEPQRNLLLPAVSAEVEAAQRVKEKPILVITGNPPYSGRPKNKGQWISNAINEYKFTWEKNAAGLNEQKPLGERNPKWLQDDYVKFVRFAQMKMDGFTYKTTAPDGKPVEHSVPGVEQGVVGVITNHSWLDNPTFRGMRQSLTRSFEQIYVLDLHGNAKKKERAPDKSDDQNVFDIEQGVAISLFVKKPGLERGVWRGDLWGKRLNKYARLAAGTLQNIEFSKLDPIARDFLFITRDSGKANQYAKGWPLNEVFREFGAGIVTAHDEFSTDFSRSELEVRFEKFRRAAGNADILHREFRVAEKEGWNILKGWQDLNKEGRPPISYIRPIVYSPFDLRFIFYEDSLVWRTVRRIMDQIDKDNVVLLSSRITKDDLTALVVSTIYRHKSATRYDITYGFPMLNTKHDVENFSKHFRTFVDERYPQQFSPEEILGYIYAVLNAPS
jgi:predicted helicase